MISGCLEPPINRFDILGVKVSAINMSEACGYIEQLIVNRQKGYVCVCPVSTIMACYDDEQVRGIVNGANLVTPDGMPTVWIGKNRGFKNIDRVYGPDLMLAMCNRSDQKRYRNYLLGSTAEILERLRLRLRAKFPNVTICGSYAPPFKEYTKQEDEKIINEINLAKPDIVWVGLGSPKQDIWIYEHREKIHAPVMIAVGAAFDFLSGAKPQAPVWMQHLGMEWFFRLCSEPRRLWKRYLIGNVRFLYHLCRYNLRGKLV